MRATLKNRRFPARQARLQGLEQLENRNLLTVSLSNVHLATDTGVSSTDKITSVATLTGDATGSPPWGGSARVEFDHNNDGTVDGNVTISNGTFTYDPVATDSALANWEGALTIKYRTKELDGYGGTVTTGDWQSFNMTLDRKTPTTSGLTTIHIEEDSPNSNVNLNDAFADGVTPDSLLTYQIISNSYPQLFDSVSISSGTLTIDYTSSLYGMAEIVIRATDQAGNYKDTMQVVDVYHTNEAPVITSFTVTPTGGGNYIFSGTVSDDNDMTGYAVFIYLTTDQYFESVIQSDQTFSTGAFEPATSFWVYAWTIDGEEAYSEYVEVAV